MPKIGLSYKYNHNFYVKEVRLDRRLKFGSVHVDILVYNYSAYSSLVYTVYIKDLQTLNAHFYCVKN